MKRIIALMLVLLAVVSLAACRENTNDPADTTDAESTAVTTEEGGEDTTVSDEETTSPEDEETTGADVETDAVTEPATDAVTEPSDQLTVNGALALCRSYLGDVDPDSGYQYSYQYEGMTDEGNFNIKVSIYIEEDDRYSKCGYLIVTPEGKITEFDW
jgi:hypothetical protein